MPRADVTPRSFVFTDAPFDSCHASTIASTPSGLVCAWFGGTREGADDVAIWSSRLDGDAWTPPACVADEPDVPCWNPVLHTTRDGGLLLFYKAGPNPREWSGFVQRSADDGRTWTDLRRLPAGILGPVRSTPLELDGGTLVCGSSVESYKAWACWVDILTGTTWTKHGPITASGGIIQPTIVAAADGTLVMFCRSRTLGRVVRATSRDGRAWSAAEAIDLPNPNSGIDAVSLEDGRIVLVYNHTGRGRTPLNVAVSSDLGLSWEPGPVLEDGPGEYSYPAVVRGTDGTLHVTYTWRRERIAYATFGL